VAVAMAMSLRTLAARRVLQYCTFPVLHLRRVPATPCQNTAALEGN
jgi:hypothetical protein